LTYPPARGGVETRDLWALNCFDFDGPAWCGSWFAPDPKGDHFIAGRELEGAGLSIQIVLTQAADREGDVGVAGAPILADRNRTGHRPTKPGAGEILTGKTCALIFFYFAPAQLFRGQTARDCTPQEICE